MNYLILDLEWNAAYSKRLKRYINEIIEIGAVILDENLTETSSFGVMVHSQLTSKLSARFRDLTSITDEEMKNGLPFAKALKEFTKFAKSADVIITWSNTDLYVFLDNCQSFTSHQTLPFLNSYLDLQPYIQNKLGQTSKNQMALSSAAEMLGLDTENYKLHRAVDDCRACADMLRKTYDEETLIQLILPADGPKFYERLLFKAYYIKDMQSKYIDRSKFNFKCDKCGGVVHKKQPWQVRNQGFFTEFKCKECGREFKAQVRFKKTWDSVIVRQNTSDIIKKEEKEAEIAKESTQSV